MCRVIWECMRVLVGGKCGRGGWWEIIGHAEWGNFLGVDFLINSGSILSGRCVSSWQDGVCRWGDDLGPCGAVLMLQDGVCHPGGTVCAMGGRPRSLWGSLNVAGWCTLLATLPGTCHPPQTTAPSKPELRPCPKHTPTAMLTPLMHTHTHTVMITGPCTSSWRCTSNAKRRRCDSVKDHAIWRRRRCASFSVLSRPMPPPSGFGLADLIDRGLLAFLLFYVSPALPYSSCLRPSSFPFIPCYLYIFKGQNSSTPKALAPI